MHILKVFLWDSTRTLPLYKLACGGKKIRRWHIYNFTCVTSIQSNRFSSTLGIYIEFTFECRYDVQCSLSLSLLLSSPLLFVSFMKYIYFVCFTLSDLFSVFFIHLFIECCENCECLNVSVCIKWLCLLNWSTKISIELIKDCNVLTNQNRIQLHKNIHSIWLFSSLKLQSKHVVYCKHRFMYFISCIYMI